MQGGRSAEGGDGIAEFHNPLTSHLTVLVLELLKS